VPVLASRSPKPWADLVFHVLAHCRDTASLPASLFDAAYVARISAALGPADGRTLAEDADALGRLLITHEALAEAQLLAWLFDDLDRASRVAATDLADLRAEDVDRPRLLAVLLRQLAGVELLRCACELERPFFMLLPPTDVAWDALERELGRAVEIAPALATTTVSVVPSLGLRGRVFGDEIWIGPSVEHGVWQAAHEATVLELNRGCRGASEREIEFMSIVLLALRAKRAGRDVAHAQWLSHFGEHAPPIAIESLSAEHQAIVRRALARSGYETDSSDW